MLLYLDCRHVYLYRIADEYSFSSTTAIWYHQVQTIGDADSRFYISRNPGTSALSGPNIITTHPAIDTRTHIRFDHLPHKVWTSALAQLLIDRVKPYSSLLPTPTHSSP